MTGLECTDARVRTFLLPGAASIVLLTATVATGAEPAQQSHPRVEIGISSWLFTQGQTKWSHNASGLDSRLGNPTSRLTYKDNDTHIIELTGKIAFSQRWFIRADVGFSAALDRGILTDDDFSAVGGQHLFSRTHSDISGNGTQYLNADMGLRIADYPGSRGHLAVFWGYQYWRTKYEATSVRQVECSSSGIPGIGCDPAGTTSHQGQLAITNTTRWHSLRLGVQSEYRLTRRFSVEGNAAFIPLSYVENEDIHHLRQTGTGALQQNPSFSMSGIGIGADVEAGARFMVARNLFLNAGYRFWWNHVADGTWKNHPVGSSPSSAPLTEFQTMRHGLTLGLSYVF